MNLSFCVWSEPGYTYYFRGEQKRLELHIASWSSAKYYRVSATFSEKAGELLAGSRGEKPPTRGGASTKREKEQGGFCPQGARFVPFPLPSAPCLLSTLFTV